MKKMTLILLTLMVGVLVFGCDNEKDVVYVEEDNPPAPPQGVYSVTADEAIYLYWLPVRESDVDYYRVWWSDASDGTYEVFGTTENTEYVDTDVDNGTTYYYAVTAVDQAGNESELSYENVFDTPRPEAFDQSLNEFVNYPNTSGFDLSIGQVVPYNSDNADFFVDFDPTLNAFFINVPDTMTDIQDMGYTYDFDEITYAPGDGWSYVGWVEVIVGHTYVIWTRDDHFAKVRVTYADYDNNDNIIFGWAYQVSTVDPGRMELSRPQKSDYLLRQDFDTRQMQLLR